MWRIKYAGQEVWTARPVRSSRCASAVALAPDDGNLRDSRGVARALVGDHAGAIEDFKAFVASARKTQPESPLIAKREEWLAALEQGRNPFGADVLAALRKSEQ